MPHPEVNIPMVELKFTDPLAAMIIDGTKTNTWRVNDEKGIRQGQSIAHLRSSDGRIFAFSRAVSVVMQTFDTLEPTDLDGHEGFTSKADMINTYRRYYGDGVNGDTEVKVIKFQPTWLVVPDRLDPEEPPYVMYVGDGPGPLA